MTLLSRHSRCSNKKFLCFAPSNWIKFVAERQFSFSRPRSDYVPVDLGDLIGESIVVVAVGFVGGVVHFHFHCSDNLAVGIVIERE